MNNNNNNNKSFWSKQAGQVCAVQQIATSQHEHIRLPSTKLWHLSLYWRCQAYISQDITWKIQQRKYDKGTAWNHWPNDNHDSLSLAWAISSACILFISSSLSILSFWKNKTTISCFRETNHKYNKLQTLTEHEFAFRDVSRFGGQLHIQVMMVFLVETEHKTRVSGHELNGQV